MKTNLRQFSQSQNRDFNPGTSGILNAIKSAPAFSMTLTLMVVERENFDCDIGGRDGHCN